jgi:hypothetical protein
MKKAKKIKGFQGGGEKMVYDDGRPTKDTIMVLSPSDDTPETVNEMVYQADYQAVAYLPSTQAINLTRGGVSVTITAATIVLNPGDIMGLSSSQAIILVPL